MKRNLQQRINELRFVVYLSYQLPMKESERRPAVKALKRFLKMVERSEICTKETPAPEGERKNWRHPDAKFEAEINEDHGDERWRCPYCRYAWIKEGPDY